MITVQQHVWPRCPHTTAHCTQLLLQATHMHRACSCKQQDIISELLAHLSSIGGRQLAGSDPSSTAAVQPAAKSDNSDNL